MEFLDTRSLLLLSMLDGRRIVTKGVLTNLVTGCALVLDARTCAHSLARTLSRTGPHGADAMQAACC
jgi:hypothetical protein